MSNQEIALQITLETIRRISFHSAEDAKTLPYEIYNSIYKNLDKTLYT